MVALFGNHGYIDFSSNKTPLRLPRPVTGGAFTFPPDHDSPGPLYVNTKDSKIMTRKARLQAWAAQLSAPVPADATMAQLEQAIETALANPVIPEPDCPGMNHNGCPWLADEAAAEIPSFRESLAIHWQIARAEVPATAKAIASNLLN